MKSIPVRLKDRSYHITVDAGLLPSLGTLVKNIAPASSYFFVMDQRIEQEHGIPAIDSFEGEVHRCSIEALESQKTITSVQQIWSSMLACGCDRQCLVIIIGGGLVGDVGGFAAATYMRGVPFVQVPTTLLAMVDASIGGKTGVNLPLARDDGSEVLGKNLAGAFWQPQLVVADVHTLQTLDDRQLRCGLAECVKHAMLGHETLRVFIQQHIDAIFARESATMINLVTQSATIKADIVALDEREAGCRALLNLGHTFAHAIEPLPELSLFHGEAVAIGLSAAVACAEVIGMIDADVVDQTRHLLTTLGLPTRLPVPVSIDELSRLMRSDKKAVDTRIRLVLPTTTGATIVDHVDMAVIGLAWASVGATT